MIVAHIVPADPTPIQGSLTVPCVLVESYDPDLADPFMRVLDEPERDEADEML
ncbi:MAG: hypothetical protein RMN25_09915 [Anaerolineae bacterium]|nr:hypothetical protein [Thermoflexales bacterium]MDW8408084.1 hypothetical protein [Anaerolineae bacterium]